jgi:hypothetical protein
MSTRFLIAGACLALVAASPAFAFVDASASAGGWGIMDGDRYWPGDWVQSAARADGAFLIQGVWQGESSGSHSESAGQSCSLPGWQNGLEARAGDALLHGNVNILDMPDIAVSEYAKQLDWLDIGIHTFHRWATAQAQVAGGGEGDAEAGDYEAEGQFEVLGWEGPGPEGAPATETPESLYGSVLEPSEQS